MKKYKPTLSSFVILGYLLAIFALVSAIFGLSKISTISSSLAGENIVNLIFAFIVAIFMALFSTDMLLRQKVSHVAYSLLGQIIVIGYTISEIVVCFSKGVFTDTTGGVFYCIALVAELLLAYAIVEKALDGDASKLFVASFIVEALFIVFAGNQIYSFFDVWAERSNNVYWLGLFDSLSLILTGFYVYFVSFKSDFEPHPIKLDQFGNPIDDKK